MIPKEIETMVEGHNLSFAYLAAKTEALTALAIELTATLPEKQKNQLLLMYFKAFYNHLKCNTSDNSDGEFDSKLHELHQMITHYQHLLSDSE